MKLALILAVASCSKSASPHASQMVTAIVDDYQTIHATLRLWQKTGADWQPVGAPWPGVVGARGVIPSHDKHEGDKKSPEGQYALGHVYGYAPAPPPGSKLPYTQTDASWKCVDDPRSQHYAQVLDSDTTTVDWASAEDMRRGDALYTWVVDTDYNASGTADAGSCIFLHVWAGPDSPTVGCTAMAEADLARLIAQLDPAAQPTFVLLTRDEYRRLSAPWGLPPQ